VLCKAETGNSKKAAATSKIKRRTVMAGDHLYAPFVESVKKVLKEKRILKFVKKNFTRRIKMSNPWELPVLLIFSAG